MTTWTCTPHFGQGPLTVGAKYDVECRGPQVSWKNTDLKLIVPEAWKYHFHVLRVENADATSLKLLATTYKVGKYNLPQDILLTDGEEKISLSPWAMDVTSVIEPTNGKPPEPFGPFGPFTLDWPIWMWWALGIIAFSILSSWVRAIQLRRRKRKWAQIVAENSTSLTPYHQFYKDFRKLARISEPNEKDLGSLDQALRLYLLRELSVPTLNQPTNFILKYIGKRSPELKKTVAPDVNMILRELQKAQAQKVSPKDFEQLSQKCRLLVDRLWEGFQEEEK